MTKDSVCVNCRNAMGRKHTKGGEHDGNVSKWLECHCGAPRSFPKARDERLYLTWPTVDLADTCAAFVALPDGEAVWVRESSS